MPPLRVASATRFRTACATSTANLIFAADLTEIRFTQQLQAECSAELVGSGVDVLKLRCCGEEMASQRRFG